MGFLIGLYLSLLACDPEAIFRNAPVIDLIDISPNRVNPYDTVYATVNATNPEEGSLTFQWSVSPERGPFLDPVDSRSVRWIAPTSGGDYVFKVVVSNSYKSTDRTGTVRVIEGGDPLVRIVFPQEDDYFIQMQEIEIIADAVHKKGKEISAAVFPTPAIARKLVRQDWERFNLDAFMPMIYFNDYNGDLDWVANVVREDVSVLQGRASLFAGLNMGHVRDYGISRVVEVCFENGAQGISFFTGNGMTEIELEEFSKIL